LQNVNRGMCSMCDEVTQVKYQIQRASANDNNVFNTTHQSKVANASVNATWQAEKLSAITVCNGNEDLPFRVQFLKHPSNQPCGHATTTLNKLRTNQTLDLEGGGQVMMK